MLRRDDIMYSIVVLIVGALVLVNVPSPAAAAETAVEVEATDESVEGLELDSDDSVELEMVPDSNEETEVTVTTEPRAVFVRGCIRPFRTVSFRLLARNRVLYCVDPDRFFDVTLRVNYLGIRSFFEDDFFEGRTECIPITSRPRNRVFRVRVTIGGFRGSFGCFFFSATP
jgi:hypothetical protein